MRENRLMFERSAVRMKETGAGARLAAWRQHADDLPRPAYPLYVARGDGCRVWDVDGVERIDFISNYIAHPRPLSSARCRRGAVRRPRG